MEIEHLIKVLQASATPCLLISGFGFLLLTMTNRLGRASDRIRQLNGQFQEGSAHTKEDLRRQIDIFYMRCEHLQKAIGFIVLSILFVSVCVLSIFVAITFNLDLIGLIKMLFGASLISLIISLSFFFMDIRQTLNSLKIEIRKCTKS